MIIPTFVEIINKWFFWVEEYKKVDLINEADKKLFYKYYWAKDMYVSLVGKYLINDIDKMMAS